MPDFTKLETIIAFSKLVTRISSNYLSFKQLKILNYGERISIGVNEFETLKIYENSPSLLSGILQTMIDLKTDYSVSKDQSFIFVADIAFYKEWWQAYSALEPNQRCNFLISIYHNVMRFLWKCYCSLGDFSPLVKSSHLCLECLGGFNSMVF